MEIFSYHEGKKCLFLCVIHFRALCLIGIFIAALQTNKNEEMNKEGEVKDVVAFSFHNFLKSS